MARRTLSYCAMLATADLLLNLFTRWDPGELVWVLGAVLPGALLLICLGALVRNSSL